MTNEDARDTLEHNWTSIHNPAYTDQELAECLDVVTKSHETMMEIVETVEMIQQYPPDRVISMGDAVLEIVWRYMREVESQGR